MSEADEQITVIEYCDLKQIPVYHIPNEARRTPQGGAWQKRQGLRPGVPDLCVPVPRGKYGALYIEMKSKRGKITHNQAEWIHRLRDCGNCAFVCYGADIALQLIDWYMAL